VTVKLSKAWFKRLKAKKSLKLSASVTFTASGADGATAATRFTLTPPRAAKKH
jgi:hypothetical protein